MHKNENLLWKMKTLQSYWLNHYVVCSIRLLPDVIRSTFIFISLNCESHQHFVLFFLYFILDLFLCIYVSELRFQIYYKNNRNYHFKSIYQILLILCKNNKCKAMIRISRHAKLKHFEHEGYQDILILTPLS